jgi:hypothetical protein
MNGGFEISVNFFARLVPVGFNMGGQKRLAAHFPLGFVLETSGRKTKGFVPW